MDPFQQTRKRLSPGYGMSPGDLMARQRYYEAEGYPYEMAEFYNETYSEVDQESPCTGKEHDIIAQIKKTPLPMARKKRARELGYLSINAQPTRIGVGVTLRRTGIKLKVKLQQLGVDLVDGLSWILGHFCINTVTDSLGSASASYFKLLRHLWLLNSLLFILIFAFICIPQLANLSEATQPPPSYNDTLTLLVDGRGAELEFSILFIGYYYGNSTSVLGRSYMLPVVYLVVMFWALIVSLLWMLFSSKGLSLAGMFQLKESAPFTKRVFASWDFNLHQESSIQEQQAVITAELKDLVAKTSYRFCKSHSYWFVYLVRLIISCLVCLLMLGGGVAIYFTVQTLKSDTCGQHYLHDPLTSYQILNLILSFRVALVVVALNLTFPWINALLMKTELYGNHQTVVVKSIRTFFMYVLSFGVLAFSLLALSEECKCQTSGYCCWETRVGQELYRLFWLDFFLEVAEVVVLDLGRAFVVRFRLLCKLSDWMGYREFDLPKQTLNLMYSQALVWFGMFFCPQLPVMAALRYLGMYILRSWAARLANLPPAHLYLSRSNVTYYSTVMLSTILALMVPLGWTVTQLPPSRTCGPFRGLSHMTQVIEAPLDAWSAAEGHLGRFGLIIQGVRSSAVVLPFVLFLSLVVLYYYNKVKTVKTTEKDLLIQLDAECRVAHERLIEAVSLIPPYDPALYEDEALGRYTETMQPNTIHPLQYVGDYNHSNHRSVESCDDTQGPIYCYDGQAHFPRPVFIGDYGEEPLPRGVN